MRWDIFCKVIDNHGDIGVCWRLAADLARRGETVRLWADDLSALPWMAPLGCTGVTPLPWHNDTHWVDAAPGDVVVEAFGCELPAAFAHQMACMQRPPVWLNLEYLTAESYAERNHQLPSPVLQGPGAGLTKHFFYPGFTSGTGGLLREPGLLAEQAAFDRADWLRQQGIVWQGERLVSLFCYEPAALDAWLHWLANDPTPTRLLVAFGRPQKAVQKVDLASIYGQNSPEPLRNLVGALSISYLPALSQTDFDRLLWACDLNFVRGEDSLVRALWAGKPLVWQLYPQHDNAHHAKLHAFLDAVHAPTSLRNFHLSWNGISPAPLLAPDWAGWATSAAASRRELLAQTDLATQLLGFVVENR